MGAAHSTLRKSAKRFPRKLLLVWHVFFWECGQLESWGAPPDDATARFEKSKFFDVVGRSSYP